MMPMPISVGRMWVSLGGDKWDNAPLHRDYGRPVRKDSRRGDRVSKNKCGHKSNPRRKN